MNYQVLITGEQDTKIAQKRRNIFLRPFLLFWLNSLFAEIIFLAVGVFIMTGTRDLLYKVLWTLVFCPLGMGGAMGGLINCFIVDHYYGKRAAHFTGILSLLILSSCNYLCSTMQKQLALGFQESVDIVGNVVYLEKLRDIGGLANGTLS